MYSAPGKLILAGEHAVVYNQPALAIPLMAVRAQVAITSAARGAGLTLHAPDLGEVWRLQGAAPLSDLAGRTLRLLDLPEPDATLTLTSSIPIASGMGSGAAVGAALVRALAGLAGQPLDAATISALVYESERAFHGTPSGIDNTVVAYEQPIIFQRQATGQPRIAPLAVGGPWHFVVGDTGVASHTKAVVGDLRQRWQADPAAYEPRFAAIGALVEAIAPALRTAAGPALGRLLDRNHAALVELGVASAELDRLVLAARDAGAWGAKMSGAGWGGVMLALVAFEHVGYVAAALRRAGATRVWTTELREPGLQS